MYAGGGFKYVLARIPAGSTTVDIGRNTHGLPFQPVVYNIVPLRTATTGEANPNSAFWWDKTAATTADGGNSVRIVAGTAPSGNPYVLGVLLGPAAPDTPFA